MTDQMVLIGKYLQQYMTDNSMKKYHDSDPFNTLVLLIYTQNKLFPSHRDQIYSKSGEFCTHLNSQQKNSPTYTLTIGDTRILTMQLVRHPTTTIEKRRGMIPIQGPNTKITFELRHGDLFILSPEDEKPALRPYFESEYPTFWHHSVSSPFPHSGHMSLGMVFRNCTQHRLVDRVTGQVILSPDELAKDNTKSRKKCISSLKRFLNSKSRDIKHKHDEHLSTVYQQMKSKYFCTENCNGKTRTCSV